MFKSLVSNLPFSPSLLPQLSFYVKRLGQEDVTRKLGLIFAILTLLVQGVMFTAPPQASLASSDNDIIFGGIGTNPEAAKQKLIDSVWGSDGKITSPYSGKTHHDLDILFAHFKITEQDIRNSTYEQICSQCTEADKNKKSLGRLNNSRDARLDIPINISASEEQYYLRPLYTHDARNPKSYYDALKIRDGVWVMLNCGNIVVDDIPNPDVKVGKVQSKANHTKLEGGQELTYRIDISNTGTGPAGDVRVYDPYPDPKYWTNVQKGENSSITLRDLNGDGTKEKVIEWKIGKMEADRSASVSFKATLRSDYVFEANDEYCNQAQVTYQTISLGNKILKTNEACIKPFNEEPEKPPEELVSKPFYECISLTPDLTEGIAPLYVTFTALGKETVKNTRFLGYQLVINGKPVGNLDQSGKFKWTFTELGAHTAGVILKTSSGSTKLDQQSPCLAENISVTPEPNESVEQIKSAKLISSFNPVRTDETDPRSKTLNEALIKTGELFEYTISLTNTGNVAYSSSMPYKPGKEDLVDALEYANVIDINARSVKDPARYNKPIQLFGGGVLEDGKVVFQPIEKFDPGSVVSFSVFMKTKDKFPATNTPASDPFSYDCVMSNTFLNSNTVNINVDCPAEKDLEMTINTLPRTGPEEVAAATIILGILSYYLFSRNRQLIREIKILQNEYNGGGSV